MNDKNFHQIKFSKFLSYLLRHGPEEYEIEFDKCGYVDFKDVLTVMQDRFQAFTADDLTELAGNDVKGRFEIKDKKIRATYGHSISVVPASSNIEPPEFLFHGTSPEGAEEILAEGLSPMGRQFVHLSTQEEDARGVALRHTEKPVILVVHAARASKEGIKFYKEGSLILSEYIPASFIKEGEKT